MFQKFLFIIAFFCISFGGTSLLTFAAENIVFQGDAQNSLRIHGDDTVYNQSLVFGNSLTHFLEWNTAKQAFVFSDNVKFSGDIEISGALVDSTGEVGDLEQILSSTGIGTQWVSSSSPVPYANLNQSKGLQPNSSLAFVIKGKNFSPNMDVSFSGFDGTVNWVKVLSPTKVKVSVTAGDTLGDYDVILSSGGVSNAQWIDNGVAFLKVVIPNGTAQNLPGESCKSLLDDGYSTGDGNYWIDPNGGSSDDSFEVFCDMTTDGGGWTKVPYSQDLAHEAHFSDGDANRWLPQDFSFSLSDNQIDELRTVSAEAKQLYHGTCQGVIHHVYNTDNFAYAFGFRFQTGFETVHGQETYPDTNISVLNDGCEANTNTLSSTDFEIRDLRLPVRNVHSRDNSSTEEFGSPLTQNPAWFR